MEDFFPGWFECMKQTRFLKSNLKQEYQVYFKAIRLAYRPASNFAALS